MIPRWVQMVLGLKTLEFDQQFAGKRKKTLTILATIFLINSFFCYLVPPLLNYYNYDMMMQVVGIVVR